MAMKTKILSFPLEFSHSSLNFLYKEYPSYTLYPDIKSFLMGPHPLLIGHGKNAKIFLCSDNTKVVKIPNKPNIKETLHEAHIQFYCSQFID